MSQEALAERCRTTKPTISSLERGTIQLTQAWMDKIAKALECQAWELISESVHIEAVTKQHNEQENNSVDAIMSLWRRSTAQVQTMFLAGIDAELKKSSAGGLSNGNEGAAHGKRRT